jgi:hypothetical protein
MKVAVDFFSPHSMQVCSHMVKEIRADQDPTADLRKWYATDEDIYFKEDNLLTETILVHSAYQLLQGNN